MTNRPVKKPFVVPEIKELDRSSLLITPQVISGETQRTEES